ncbi:hypothetical protein [Pedococcus sp. P5_B7]
MSSDWLHEARIYLVYASLTVRTGAPTPRLPVPGPQLPYPPADWDRDDLGDFIAEARRSIDGQQADKRETRSRAQVVLSTALLLGGAVVASYGSVKHPGWLTMVTFLLAFVLDGSAVLAAAGILTGRSDIGAPYLPDVLAAERGGCLRVLAREYAEAEHLGHDTVAAMVTGLRTTVLVMVASFLMLAITHPLTH